jgi:hypothetical protein
MKTRILLALLSLALLSACGHAASTLPAPEDGGSRETGGIVGSRHF